ncbi:family 6 glucosyltransferase [Roseburia inulinivorans]|nr:family 6 glucosyltransferase [Roseburia inulinivorans]
MNKVAVLYICTGKYDVFWKDFYISYEKYFLPDCEKHYYVFTDAAEIYMEKENLRIHKFYQESLGWPDNTLMRFHMFLRQKAELEKYDYIFFMNANCQALDTITEEEFLPKKKDIIVVQHPGYYNKTNKQFAYDRNPKSTAYIPKGQGKYYVCGGVNGGRAQAFIQLMEELKHNIDVDKKNGELALWHDESHINHYVWTHDNYEVLPPSYCWPEDWNLPMPGKILIREKSKWIFVDMVKSQSLSGKIKAVIKKIIRR